MMNDQVIIDNKASFDDFEASMKERTVEQPSKKSVKDTVPFSNKTYDFSRINGEEYWNERDLEYVFEILADSPEQLEEKKQKFLNWIMFVQQQPLHDPYITDYHFVATFDSVDVDDSEIEKSTITVTFKAYPYKIADFPTQYNVSLAANAERVVTILNESSHKVVPTLTAAAPFTITKGPASFAIPEGETADDAFDLDPGENTLTVKNIGTTNAMLTISFFAEVM